MNLAPFVSVRIATVAWYTTGRSFRPGTQGVALMRALMRTFRFGVLAVLLVFALHTQAATLTVNDAGDAGLGNCAREDS